MLVEGITSVILFLLRGSLGKGQPTLPLDNSSYKREPGEGVVKPSLRIVFISMGILRVRGTFVMYNFIIDRELRG